ncbi:uncharacterized protein CDAR_445311 [Caerostris darwini]|uniref:Uncharacterized protein n=1 Tax=Caerostris darwini TaxID=1538125 RepID=A0AAV4SA57_9ARAC|nr:uncharacterized protein CDAR_445311 [Caerostris darwini]
MLCWVVLSSLMIAHAYGHLFYPFLIPIRMGNNHRYTTHVVAHPIIRTKVLLLEEKKHHYQQSPNQLQIGDYHHYHYKSQPYSHQKNEFRNKIPNQEARTQNPLKTRHKWSTPTHESPWKPIPTEYLPLKYHNEMKVSKVLYDSIKETHQYKDDDDEANLILPVGIKKLHNPQLRLPSSKKLSSVYSSTEGRHTHHPIIYKNQPDRKVPESENNYRNIDFVHCHCRIP